LKRKGLIILMVGALLASCAGGTPDLVLDQEEIDIGQVINGEIRTIEMPLRNIGERDLVIEGVSTSCGCTQAKVEPSTIPPGESGVLVVEYDSGAHGPEANGPVLRQIFIASNDTDQPEVEFRFTAEVIAKDP
jgi:hypothetical protein